MSVGLDEADRPGVVTDAPERIWLIYGDLDRDCSHSDCDEVTWCSEAQYDSDVEYIRIDRHQAEKEALAAELRRLEAEIDRLRDSKERIHRRAQEAEAERDALKAECERLRAQEEISTDVIAFYQGKYFELDAANAGLATESERLRSGLRWYAHGEHYAGLDDWEEGADPECPNWMEPTDDGASGAMVENGHCARLVLSGQTPDWDGEPPMEHPCEPVMQAIAALTPPEQEKQTLHSLTPTEQAVMEASLFASAEKEKQP